MEREWGYHCPGIYKRVSETNVPVWAVVVCDSYANRSGSPNASAYSYHMRGEVLGSLLLASRTNMPTSEDTAPQTKGVCVKQMVVFNITTA